MTGQFEQQQEYNSLLELTQSMLGKIGNSMSEISNQSDKRNKKLKEQVSISKQIVDSLREDKDVNAAIIKLKKQNNEISSQSFGVNEALKKSLLQQNLAMQGVLQKQKVQQAVLTAVGDVTSEISDKFANYLDTIDDGLKSIPIFGKALSGLFQPFKEKSERIIFGVARSFLRNFQTAFTQSQAAGDGLNTSIGKGLTGGLKSSYALLNRLSGGFGPLVIGALAFAGALYLGFQRFKEIDAAAQKFREETGLLVSQTGQVANNIKSVSTEFAGLGVSAEDVATAASDFTKEFDGLQQPSKEVLGSMVALNKNFGIGTKEASELNKVFQNIGGLSAEQSQILIGQTTEMAKMAGVAPQQVIKDMAENSGLAYKYFNGSPEALAQAAVQAAKLGTSIKQAGEVADNLLDFETSITAELEASAILGTNLNLSQARYLAANGDILGAQQAVLDQVANLGDLTKLNTYEQKALADATGMQMGDLINQQRIREQFGKLDKEQLAAAMSLMNSGRDISKLNSDDLKAQTKRMASQKEMQSLFENMSNEIGAIKTALFDAFEPVAAFVIPLISGVVSMVSGILVPAFKGLGTIIGYAFTPLTWFINGLKEAQNYIMENKAAFVAVAGLMGGILGYQIAINAQKLIEFGLTAKKYLLDKGTLLFQIAKNAATIVYNGILTIGNSIKKKGLLSSIAEMAMKAFTSLSSIPVVGPVLGIAAAAAAAALGYSYFSKAGDVNSPADGKTRISTKEGGLFELSPNDDLLAAPGLSDAMSGGSGGSVNISMDGVIFELQELRAAFLSNKDVYMDREKVSSAVVRTNEKSGENRFGLMGA
jgi:methyl-accepting chemotaxis protein